MSAIITTQALLTRHQLSPVPRIANANFAWMPVQLLIVSVSAIFFDVYSIIELRAGVHRFPSDTRRLLYSTHVATLIISTPLCGLFLREFTQMSQIEAMKYAFGMCLLGVSMFFAAFSMDPAPLSPALIPECIVLAMYSQDIDKVSPNTAAFDSYPGIAHDVRSDDEVNGS